jgi:hypothetical protein
LVDLELHLCKLCIDAFVCISIGERQPEGARRRSTPAASSEDAPMEESDTPGAEIATPATPGAASTDSAAPVAPATPLQPAPVAPATPLQPPLQPTPLAPVAPMQASPCSSEDNRPLNSVLKRPGSVFQQPFARSLIQNPPKTQGA